MNRRLLRASTTAIAAVASAACAQTPAPTNFGPYVPTPTVIVTHLLKLADLKPGEYIIDLGSGDGRIVNTAAKQYGARGMGVDIKPELVELATKNAREAGVGDRVKFVAQDLFTLNVNEANVVTLYLLPSTVTKLIPKFLEELKPGTRIVSHDYSLAPWEHERVEEYEFDEKVQISGTTRTVLYRYIVPANVVGTWDAQLPAGVGKVGRFVFTRDPTLRVRGTAEVDGRSVALDNIKVTGTALSFDLPAVAGLRQRTSFTGRIDGGALKGEAVLAAGAAGWAAKLRR
jgi:SAM-dependent methyltransferase